jgi:hypothetical protein
MVSYIYKVYIDKEYYVNYADAPPRVFAPVGLLERAGKNMGNNTLAAFTSYLRVNNYCHNDVGNFLLYCDSVPVLVEAGVETYTKFTFSSARYGIWTMQSGYHNLPTLNGIDQEPGKEHCAKAVSLTGG